MLRCSLRAEWVAKPLTQPSKLHLNGLSSSRTWKEILCIRRPVKVDDANPHSSLKHRHSCIIVFEYYWFSLHVPLPLERNMASLFLKNAGKRRFLLEIWVIFLSFGVLEFFRGCTKKACYRYPCHGYRCIYTSWGLPFANDNYHSIGLTPWVDDQI